jgi:hypothetical protein
LIIEITNEIKLLNGKMNANRFNCTLKNLPKTAADLSLQHYKKIDSCLLGRACYNSMHYGTGDRSAQFSQRIGGTSGYPGRFIVSNPDPPSGRTTGYRSGGRGKTL